MTCCDGPVVIGESCDDQINYGETIDLELVYKDENGAPINVSTAVPSIFSSTPDVIKDHASLTITDGPNGKVRFLLDRTHALDLRRGRNNRFRIQMVFGADSDDITPDIWLQVT